MAKRTAVTKKSNKPEGPPKDRELKKAADAHVQSDMPRKYRMCLAAQKFSKANNKEAAAGKTAKQGGTGLKIAPRAPGESLGEYNRRVDDTVRATVNAAVQSTSKTRQKKKAWLKVRKTKAASKSKGEDSADEEERRAQTEKIKFGVVAMQPPSITAVPKKRGGNAAAIEALQKFQAAKAQDQSDGDENDEDEDGEAATNGSGPKLVGRKRKLKTLPEVERIAITNARENAIAHYRAMKASSNNLRERADGSDNDGMESD
ncbi:hypothetical protein HDU86_000394 [Geranomyces michiganensis]|nr:hypothetical protein HDU86_000394 [Geranomyces michiganensis]